MYHLVFCKPQGCSKLWDTKTVVWEEKHLLPRLDWLYNREVGVTLSFAPIIRAYHQFKDLNPVHSLSDVLLPVTPIYAPLPVTCGMTESYLISITGFNDAANVLPVFSQSSTFPCPLISMTASRCLLHQYLRRRPTLPLALLITRRSQQRKKRKRKRVQASARFDHRAQTRQVIDWHVCKQTRHHCGYGNEWFRFAAWRCWTWIIYGWTEQTSQWPIVKYERSLITVTWFYDAANVLLVSSQSTTPPHPLMRKAIPRMPPLAMSLTISNLILTLSMARQAAHSCRHCNADGSRGIRTHSHILQSRYNRWVSWGFHTITL